MEILSFLIEVSSVFEVSIFGGVVFFLVKYNILCKKRQFLAK